MKNLKKHKNSKIHIKNQMKKLKKHWQNFQNQYAHVDGNVEYLSLRQRSKLLKQSMDSHKKS